MSSSSKPTTQDETQRPLLAPDGNHENYGTQETNPEEPRSTFSRQLNAFNGFALLISVIIGSGIFASPAQVDSNVGSPGAALLIWGLFRPFPALIHY
jgi:L-type amino acid transporter 9